MFSNLSTDGTASETTKPDESLRCVACGYILFGLGEEPRCPECGLINAPRVFREAVWKLVDSRRCFFSNPFRPFKKRPPGWWWSLDREGDVNRATKYAAKMVALSFCLLFMTAAVANSYVLEKTTTYFYVTSAGQRDLAAGLVISQSLLGTRLSRNDDEFFTVNPAVGAGHIFARKLVFGPALSPLAATLGSACWPLLLWIVPGLVGVTTQIRRNLPAYARPRRTIVSAVCLEAHRLIYLSVLLCVLRIVYVLHEVFALHIWMPQYAPEFYFVPLVFLYGAASWIGPLRSDFTCQIVRGRRHLWRIVFMYGFALPFAFWVTGSTAIFALELTR